VCLATLASLMATAPTIAVVSPHLDDAVLSVGGLLWVLQERYRVEVITVFTADPPDVVSPAAAALAGGYGADISAARRAEDERALALLGVGHRHLDLPDAVHRRAPTGRWLVDEVDHLFRTAPDEALVDLVATALAECLGEGPLAGVLSPVAVGGHVDHRATAAAVARLAVPGAIRLSWIDLPYGSYDRADEPRLRVPVPDAAWRAKVAAIACYESQVAELLPGPGDLDRRVRRMSDGPYEWFAAPAPGVEPDPASILEDLLGWYVHHS
jgi:LmbE family N-acetylglucosaminyl deacetylase